MPSQSGGIRRKRKEIKEAGEEGKAGRHGRFSVAQGEPVGGKFTASLLIFTCYVEIIA